MKKILVTGGAGFIGNNLVRKLNELGYEVCVLDDFSRGVNSRLSDIESNIKILDINICDIEQLLNISFSPDVIIHLAAVNGTENFYNKPDKVLEVGVKGLMNIMDFSIKSECKKFIFASSAEVYHHPEKIPTDEFTSLIIPDNKNSRFSYSSSKIIGEMLCFHYLQKRGVDTLVFRPHNIYGPDMGFEHVIPQFCMKMLESAKEKGSSFNFQIQGNGKETRAFCFIDDAVDGIICILENGISNELYHIGNTHEINIETLAYLISKKLNFDINLKTGPLMKGSTVRRAPDITKAMKIGYKPRIGLDEGVGKSLKWYKNYFNSKEQ